MKMNKFIIGVLIGVPVLAGMVPAAALDADAATHSGIVFYVK